MSALTTQPNFAEILQNSFHTPPQFVVDSNCSILYTNPNFNTFLKQEWDIAFENNHTNFLTLIKQEDFKERFKKHVLKALNGEKFHEIFKLNFGTYTFSYDRILAEELAAVSITINPRQSRTDREQDTLTSEIERISNLGYFQYLVQSDLWIFSPQLKLILGIESAENENLDSCLTLTDPKERKEFEKHFREDVLGKKLPLNRVCRITHRVSQEGKYIYWKGDLILDENDQPTVLNGVIQDITQILDNNNEFSHISKFAEHTQIGLLVTDSSGVTTWVHPSMKMISGHTQEELIGKTPGEVLQGKNTDPAHIEAFKNGIASKKPFKQEILNYSKDGRPIWNEVQVTPMFDENGEVREFLGIQIDITARKKLENELAERESRLRNITNSIPGAIFRFVLNPDKSVELLFVSDGIKHLYGSPENIHQNFNLLRDKTHKDDLDEIKNSLYKSAENLSTWICEWRVKQNHDSYLWVRAHGSPVSQEDGSIIWDAFISNVSEIKNAQHAERKARNQFENIVNSVSGIIWEANSSFNFLYVSGQAEKITGYRPDEWLEDQFWTKYIHPDDKDWAVKFCKSKFRKREYHQFEYRFRHKNGEYIWLRDMVNCVKSPSGKWLLQGIMIDITKEKVGEIRRREVEKKYRYLTENTSDIISVQDMNMRYTYVSESVKNVLGFQPKELVGQSEKKITLKEDYPLLNRMDFTQSGYKETTLEYRLLQKNGSPQWFRVIKKVVNNEFSQRQEIISSYTDISEKKRTELDLVQNEQKYRILAENTSDAVVLFNQDWTLNYISPGTEKIFGYSMEEYMQLDPMAQVFEDDRGIIEEVIRLIDEGKSEFVREYRMYNKRSEVIWVETRTHVIRQREKIHQIITNTNDITLRKTAELNQKETLEQLQLAVSSANVGVWTYDLDTSHFTVNHQLTEMFDLDTKAFFGGEDQFKNKIHPDDLPLFVETFDKILSGSSVSNINLRIKKDDKIKHIAFSGSPIFDDHDQVTGSVGVNLDITDVIERKDQLRKKIHQLEIATKTAKIGLFTQSLSNNKVEYNDEILDIYEVSRTKAEQDGLGWEEKIIQEDKAKAIKGYESLVNGIKTGNEERFRIDSKNGKIKHIYAVGTTTKNMEGASEIIGVNMDISYLVENEKKLVEALKSKEMLLRELHHRVKNNLQMVSSILHVKSRDINDKKLQEVIKDVNSKIVSVANVHESLLLQDSTSIDLNKYIRDLIKNLIESFSEESKAIKWNLNVRKYKLESELIFTLGLIIHEIMTTILKNTYVSSQLNEVLLSFDKKEDYFNLLIEENRKNTSQNLLKNSASILLIKTLANSMHGNFTLNQDDNTSYHVTFPTRKSKINSTKY